MKHNLFWAHMRQTIIHVVLLVFTLFAGGVAVNGYIYGSTRAFAVVLLSLCFNTVIIMCLRRHPAFSKQKQIDAYYYYVAFISQRTRHIFCVVAGVCFGLTLYLWFYPTIMVKTNFPNAVELMRNDFGISALVMSLLGGTPGSFTQMYYGAAEASIVETEEAIEDIANTILGYRNYSVCLILVVLLCGWSLSVLSRVYEYKRVSKLCKEVAK